MTDHKFTDEEIKTGLRCLSGEIILCKFCAFSHLEDRGFACKKNVANAALALINRQKAEIERLNNHFLDATKKVKAEAIKEFAENVKAIFECVLYFDDDIKECILNEIDELVKEMTEEKTNEFPSEST